MQENKVYIALGSNIGNRKQYLQTALEIIKDFAQIKAQSSIYETKPVGYKEQEDFLNMVIEINTDLTPVELLIKLQETEHSLGRTREIKNGPRTIDLDIILYNHEKINHPNLQIPHPRAAKRDFVMNPLREIASENTLKQLA